MRRVARRDAAVLAFATAMAFVGSLAAPPAEAAPVSNVLGIPCTTGNLQLRLPVHESPGGQVLKPLAPLDRDGMPAKRRELAGS